MPSGKKVMAAIREGGAWPLLSTPMLRLEAKWEGPPRPFGCGYACAIGDTVTSPAEGGRGGAGAAAGGGGGGGGGGGRQETAKDEAAEQGSFEYLVFASAFSAVAAKHGLSALPRWGAGAAAAGPRGNPAAATAAERLLDPADEGSHFKSFAPHFPGSDPSLERASELFQAFVFVRDADGGSEGGEDEDFVEEEEGEGEEEEKEKEEKEKEEEAEEKEAGERKKRKV